MSMRWGSELPRQRYRSSKEAQVSPLGAWYRRHLAKRPFLFFGLPFVSLVVAGSFALTPVTALRYERYDLKARQLSQEEAMQIGKDKKPFNIQEEYFKLSAKGKDLDNWENKRYPRKPGEHDGILK